MLDWTERILVKTNKETIIFSRNEPDELIKLYS